MPKKHSSNAMLRFLYHTPPGRAALRVVSGRRLSSLCGHFLDSRCSRVLVKRYMKKNDLCPSDYVYYPFQSFNDCFSRKIKAELRPVNDDPYTLVSPCDGLLSVYRISKGTILPIKQSQYTVRDLLGGNPIAAQYEHGSCLVFRLTPSHYHRYCYIDDGVKGENIFLPGKLHTVQPIALADVPVFIQNCREYTIMDTVHFGRMIQIEVGAMLVGKIQNHHGAGSFVRGQEKGMFQYGGSTIILLFEEGRLGPIDPAYQENTGAEMPVRLGQSIFHAADHLEIE